MKKSKQVTTVVFFRYEGLRRQFWAFRHLGLAPSAFSGIPGLKFCKIMGSRYGADFSWKPDWAVYCLLCVWEKPDFAKDFFNKNARYRNFKRHTILYRILWMRAIKAYGTWSGQQPFRLDELFSEEAPVVVLTIAKIRWTKLIHFWRAVPAVTQDMKGRYGLLFSKGIGERPWIQLATLSVWNTRAEMRNFAYRDKVHAGVVKKARQHKWFREDLFAEFKLIKVEGSGTDDLFGV